MGKRKSIKEMIYDAQGRLWHQRWCSDYGKGGGRTTAMVETVAAAVAATCRDRNSGMYGHCHLICSRFTTIVGREKIKIKLWLTPLYVLLILFVHTFAVFEQGMSIPIEARKRPPIRKIHLETNLLTGPRKYESYRVDRWPETKWKSKRARG